MALTTDLIQAIEKNLSSEVGTTLRKRLEQAEHDAIEIVRLDKQNKEFASSLSAMVDKVKGATLVLERESKLGEREAAVLLREKVCELREAHCTARISDHLMILTKVFEGPAKGMAFNVMGSFPMAMPGQTWPQPQTFSASVEATEKL